jgi:ABC-2 type transport system ATP-binding protein
MLLGLVRPDSGDVRLLDRSVPRELPAAIGEVGALVETPAFFPAFSGRRNLELLAGVAGVPARRIDEVLTQVDLRDRQRDRVKGYSLGMKQRLGIAAALLKSPRLLILDEPTNGLDPAGIREIRELIRTLGGGGTTVFLSSHLLSEVEQVCDSVAILAHGRLITAGRVRDVLAANRRVGEFRVAAPDNSTAASVLRRAGLSVTESADGMTVTGTDDGSLISRTLAEGNVFVSELTPLMANLESVFLDLTEDKP